MNTTSWLSQLQNIIATGKDKKLESTLSPLFCSANSSVDKDTIVEVEISQSRAVQYLEQKFGPSHWGTLSTKLNLAKLYALQSKWNETTEILEEVLKTQIQKFGVSNLDTFNTADGLCEIYLKQDLLDKAEERIHWTLKGKKATLGYSHDSTLQTYKQLGMLYEKQGEWNKATQIVDWMLETKKTKLGPFHKSTLDTFEHLGTLHEEQGKLEAAEQTLKQTLKEYTDVHGLTHVLTLSRLYCLGLLYICQGKLDDARGMFTQALLWYDAVFGHLPISDTSFFDCFDNLCLKQKSLNDARMFERESQGGGKTGPNQVSTSETPSHLEFLSTDKKRSKKKQQTLEIISEEHHRALMEFQALASDMANKLGRCYASGNKRDEAQVMFDMAENLLSQKRLDDGKHIIRWATQGIYGTICSLPGFSVVLPSSHHLLLSEVEPGIRLFND